MMQRLEAIYHAAAAIADPLKRESYLAEACAGDRKLRRRLDVMLRVDLDARQFLDTVESSDPRRHSPATPLRGQEQVGDLIGPYRLLEPLGHGGFGTVWMAEQRAPVVRRVAIKILKLGMDSRQVIARFEAERQALAMMEHPHIARVFDAGATDAGRPYFVMELVRGEPITDYCDRARLTIPDRLHLFRQVCAGVQHAHSKGVIHRDLKPSNVLVTLSDGVPGVKIIDFGIAKAANQLLTDKTLHTEMGQFIGTPAYMSPEQAAGSPDIDTRSDIYALGVLLYELLTGEPPCSGDTLRGAAFLEVQRIIREVDPPRPSTRISSHPRLADIAARRGAEPRRLRGQLRGDLDWIVMRAIDKDRQRRYASAAELADDNAAHLENRPVRAGRPSVRYRVEKFVRRNRLAVAAGSTVLLALVTGAVAASVGLLQARALNEQLEATNRDLERVVAFQREQLASVDAAAIGRDTRDELRAQVEAGLRRGRGPDDGVNATLATLDEALQFVDFTGLSLRGLERGVFRGALETIAADFADQPSLQARLYQTTALTMHELGLLQAARAPQERALELRAASLGECHPDTVESRLALANLLNSLGEFEDAERHYRAIREAGDAAAPKHSIQATRLLGGILMHAGRLDEAETLIEESLARSRRELGEDHAETLANYNALGLLRARQMRFDEIEPLYRKVLEGRRRVLGPHHSTTLTAMCNLAVALRRAGRLDEAEALMNEALPLHRAALGNDHLSTINALMVTGGILSARERHDEAATTYAEALASAKRLFGPAHDTTLQIVAILADARRAQGRDDEADALQQRLDRAEALAQE
jgi:serine/threonine protein kinase/tetratricopeptide (TPR) repeat protein